MTLEKFIVNLIEIYNWVMSTRSRKQKKGWPTAIKSFSSCDVKVQDKSTLQSFKGKPPKSAGKRKWTNEAEPDYLFRPDNVVNARPKISSQKNTEKVNILKINDYIGQLGNSRSIERNWRNFCGNIRRAKCLPESFR